MSMNQFKEQFIKNLTHEELITEYEAKFALCEHLEDEVQRLSRERSKLAEEVVSLEVKLNTSEAKLSEFQEGLPIEEAKECGDYYCLDLGYCVATYFENGKWYYSDDGPNRNPCEVSNRLYPLPSTETQMEGE